MIRHLAVCAMVAATAVSAMAEPDDAGLNLTEEQRTTMKSLDADMKAQIEDIRARVRAGNLSRAEARSQTQDIGATFREDRRAILTAEQLQVLQESRPEGAGRGHRRGQRGRGPLTELGRSEAQGEQLRNMRDEHRIAMDSLRESGNATPEDFQQLRETQRREIDAILTDEQRETLEQRREERGSKGEGRGRHGGGRGGRRGSERAR